MTDEQHDAQTLAYSQGIERMHVLRFGPQRRTWVCSRCNRVRSNALPICLLCEPICMSFRVMH